MRAQVSRLTRDTLSFRKMKLAAFRLLMPMALYASRPSQLTIYDFSQLNCGNGFKTNHFNMISQALESPSDASPRIIQEIMDAGGDVMEAIDFYLEHEGCTLEKIEFIITLLPRVAEKCWIPCVSHYGSLYSICSKVYIDELNPALELIASVSTAPPTSVDVWNIITQHFYWRLGPKERHSVELVKALNLLLEKGCPLNIPLLYKRYQDISNDRFDGKTIIPTGELGWFNPVMHLLWDNEALGMEYLVHSLIRCGANPSEKVFSHVLFMGQDKAQTRSILGHVLIIFTKAKYFGKAFSTKIVTILIAFGANTAEFFHRDPDAIGGDLLDEKRQKIIIDARKKIQEAKEKLWLLQLTHSELELDVRRRIGEMVVDLII